MQHKQPGKYLDTHDGHPDPEWIAPKAKPRRPAGLSAMGERVRNKVRDLRLRNKLTGSFKKPLAPEEQRSTSSGSQEPWRPPK